LTIIFQHKKPLAINQTARTIRCGAHVRQDRETTSPGLCRHMSQTTMSQTTVAASAFWCKDSQHSGKAEWIEAAQAIDFA